MTADIKLLPLPVAGEAMSKWAYHEADMEAYARANVAHATTAQDAEIERLREEREVIGAEAMKYAGKSGRLEVKVERLAEALRKVDEQLDNWAVDQCHDTIEAALHPTAATQDAEIEAKPDEWVLVPREMLEAAVCPMGESGCDGTQYPVQPYGEGEQCQWCYERRAALSAQQPTAVDTADDSLSADALAAALEDAERWREAEKHFRIESPDMGGKHRWTWTGHRYRGPSIAAAIDAARKGQNHD